MQSLIYFPSRREHSVSFQKEGDIICTETRTPAIVTSWISFVERVHRRQKNMIVALDVKWVRIVTADHFRGNKPAPMAILHICVGHRTIMFHLQRDAVPPPALRSFLANPNYVFVGVGIKDKLHRLQQQYGVFVDNIKDLRNLAVKKLDSKELWNAGLETLALKVLGHAAETPADQNIRVSQDLLLKDEQIKQACLHVFLCFEIGRVLNS